MKVYFSQAPGKSQNGGIKRVLEAQYRYLPEFGIEITPNLAEAEVTVGHVSDCPLADGVPYINHNHGLMWSEYKFPQWAEQVNAEIVQAMRHAYTITCPSQWVAKAVQRGVYFPVQTIYHGVDTEEWKPGKHSDFVLWNKARQDEVSNPEDMQRLAELLPEVKFLSTLGKETPNVEVIGVLDNDSMKELVQYAGLYLCTARETFGIGTLEALACGVPVVGWDYGGQHEIIVQGDTGYLAPYGDYTALAECVRRAMADRPRLSRNARDDVRQRWGWRDKIREYADLYKSAAAWHTAPRPKVSVIVPAHNLAKYLPYTLQSIQQQTLTAFECIIIDDQSNDETPEIARAIVSADIRFRYHRTYENLKLSRVRNLGAELALGKYIVFIDADDLIPPTTLEILSDALDRDRSLHIVYGALDLINEEHTHQRRNRFPSEFNWYHQMAHQNQVPTGAMMRREVVLQSGGWRSRQWRAEDAEYWARVTSFGYQAKKVTDETTLLYRVRSDSKGSTEFRTYEDHDGNWLANIAWRSANSASEGIDYLKSYGETIPQPQLAPFGSHGKPNGDKFWNVSHQQEPLVTLIVSGGKHLEDTLDAIMGQYENRWEVIVIGSRIPGFPYVHFVAEDAQPQPHSSQVIHLEAGQLLSSDWLQKQLNLGTESIPLLSGSKVLLQYIGRNLAPAPFRVHGRRYMGSNGKFEWVEPEDVESLVNRGQWKKVTTPYVPAPAVADQRKD